MVFTLGRGRGRPTCVGCISTVAPLDELGNSWRAAVVFSRKGVRAVPTQRASGRSVVVCGRSNVGWPSQEGCSCGATALASGRVRVIRGVRVSCRKASTASTLAIWPGVVIITPTVQVAVVHVWHTRVVIAGPEVAIRVVVVCICRRLDNRHSPVAVRVADAIGVVSSYEVRPMGRAVGGVAVVAAGIRGVSMANSSCVYTTSVVGRPAKASGRVLVGGTSCGCSFLGVAMVVV